jgi:hypothetical protein
MHEEDVSILVGIDVIVHAECRVWESPDGLAPASRSSHSQREPVFH